MHLSSIIENDGLKSKKHYLITHHNDRRDLLILPESYAGLEKEVERLYHIGRGQFYLETDEFNLCRGTRVRIPKQAWDDVAQLPGNLHIVSSQPGSNDGHPESAPEVEEMPIEPETQGQISINQSFEEGSVLLVKMGKLNFNVPVTPSTEFRLQLLDSNRNSAIAISVFSQSILFKTPSREVFFKRTLRATFPLQSQHEVVVYQHGALYYLLCDRQVVGQMEGSRFFLSAVSYDLGVRSPFNGPVAAVVYADVDAFLREAPLYQSTLGSKALYQKVIACNPSYSSDIRQQLSKIRSGEFGTGVQWRKHTTTPYKWINLEWDYHKRSILVIRLTPQASKDVAIYFGPTFPKYTLVVTFQENLHQLKIWYCDETENRVQAGLLDLTQSAQLASEHSVAFVRHQNNIHIVVDFCQSFALPDTLFMRRNPEEMQFNVPRDWGLEADVYYF